jgi:hypothetical protein
LPPGLISDVRGIIHELLEYEVYRTSAALKALRFFIFKEKE